ncbi:methionine-R-sulfoxide reductase B2, mitochondrial isoform X1 [Leopardus geoffroyi]|uniref:methionine-R-sulfoxide reductase B2, mitochondrial isoform X1 n=1 Tax=Leopardus geoffroyi TaxID=46844 RepID=UPI001E26507E|nr:methionine-R-sulfoxide reductase B2, mitochondrial isoform X1 [Leopardus geoffroyi]
MARLLRAFWAWPFREVARRTGAGLAGSGGAGTGAGHANSGSHLTTPGPSQSASQSLTRSEWQKKLTPEGFYVTRRKGTDPRDPKTQVRPRPSAAPPEASRCFQADPRPHVTSWNNAELAVSLANEREVTRLSFLFGHPHLKIRSRVFVLGRRGTLALGLTQQMSLQPGRTIKVRQKAVEGRFYAGHPLSAPQNCSPHASLRSELWEEDTRPFPLATDRVWQWMMPVTSEDTTEKSGSGVLSAAVLLQAALTYGRSLTGAGSCPILGPTGLVG